LIIFFKLKKWYFFRNLFSKLKIKIIFWEKNAKIFNITKLRLNFFKIFFNFLKKNLKTTTLGPKKKKKKKTSVYNVLLFSHMPKKKKKRLV